jgi:hypothetical protein
MPTEESKANDILRCAYCNGAMCDVMDHARECREMHISAKECMPDVGRDVFDYIEMPCGDVIKRWTFTNHVAGCMECASVLAQMMYGENNDTWRAIQ